MRVISGKYKGKRIESIVTDITRPTMDRVKESMFAIIQNYLKNSIVLDLFAGSGSLGIEALSNGAKECYFIDNNKEALKTIIQNTKDIEKAIIINNDSLKFLDETKIKFDIIFLDPPYYEELMEKTLNKIIKNDLLKKNGIVVCEFEKSFICNFLLIKEKKYGNKKIHIYQNNIK